MRGLRYAWVMAVLSLCGIVPTPARAGVTQTGDRYDNGSSFYAGYNANTTGGLTIDAGSVFNRSYGYLGYGYPTGATGTAIVTGAGSKWTNSSELYVGYNGSGTLSVEAGAQVSNAKGYLGYYGGSTGAATITGVGSKWTNSSELWVGYYGNGTLTASNGGTVSAKTLYASLGDLYGNGTITVQSGGVLDADLSFDATHGLTQTLAFGSGGTLQFTADSKNVLGVGYTRSGSLRVADGRSVSSAYGYLGYYSGSAGEAIITGAGSKWTNTGFSGILDIGYCGSGTLRVEAGGQVSNGDGSLGDKSGSTGTATISGAASKWTNFGNLYIGYYGSGTLCVEAGGQVSNGYGYLGRQSGSTGTAVITGVGSKWTNSGEFYVGQGGSGTLRVEAGGQVSNIWSAYLGYDSGSTGTAIITGAGSKWTNSGSLAVGHSGSGELTVSDGGQVTATSLYINSQSIVRLHVSSDRMLVLGDSSNAAKVSNDGKLSLLADAFLSAGTYRPIGAYADRTMAWSGSGSTFAVGGTWDRDAGTFTVIAPTLVDAGTSAEVAGGMRLVIRDGGSGERVGVSFGVLSSGTTMTSLPLTESERAGLLPLLGSKEMILSGWDFVGQLAGDEALMSFEVGIGAENLRLWRRSQDGWSEYTPEMMTYDSKGIVSFTVDPASLNSGGYAVSVPEPAALGLMAILAATLLSRRRLRPEARG